MSNFNQFFEQKVVPVTGKMSSNKAIKAITTSMMATMPLSLGTSLVAIVANFPITSWTNFLAVHGINVHATAIIGGTTQIMGLFLAFLVAYNLTKLLGHDEITGGILSLGTFIILMPQTYALAEGASLSVLQMKYLGSSGIFVSMIVGILIAYLYCFLEKKGFVIKFPDSVPDMISKSLSPTFIAMIIFSVVFAVRIGFGYTSYGNMFDFINNTVAQPIMFLGSSPISLIILYAIGNFFWCFGIHPSSVLSFYVPVLMTALTGNIEAFQSGSPLPYLTFIIIYTYIMLGGTGSTLGLAFDMLLFSKSKRFKALGKLVIIPNLFNINEPLIFGTPIIFNPVFMIPMVATPFINGGIAALMVRLGAYSTYNPNIKMPWTMPGPVTALVQTGIWASLGVCLAIVATAILYYPFFKYADKQAIKEEMQEETAKAL